MKKNVVVLLKMCIFNSFGRARYFNGIVRKLSSGKRECIFNDRYVHRYTLTQFVTCASTQNNPSPEQDESSYEEYLDDHNGSKEKYHYCSLVLEGDLYKLNEDCLEKDKKDTSKDTITMGKYFKNATRNANGKSLQEWIIELKERKTARVY